MIIGKHISLKYYLRICVVVGTKINACDLKFPNDLLSYIC